MSERVLFCVDVSNLWDACRTKFGQSSRIDFEVLKNIYPSAQDITLMVANRKIILKKEMILRGSIPMKKIMLT